MKLKLTLLALGALFALGAVETPQAWPQQNGDTCYTYFASLSCTAAQLAFTSPTPVATLPPTDLPATQTPLPTAPPTASPSATAAPPVVSMVNPGFESGLTGWTQLNLIESAQITSERISGGADTLAVHSGDSSIKLYNGWYCFHSVLYQTVSVPVGRNVKASAWFLTLGSGVFDLHHADYGMNSEVGILIDLYGLTDPESSDVIFKYKDGSDVFPNIGGGYSPVWKQVSLTARTLSDSLTVFLSADLGKARTGNCMWRNANLLAIMDNVGVEVLP